MIKWERYGNNWHCIFSTAESSNNTTIGGVGFLISSRIYKCITTIKSIDPRILQLNIKDHSKISSTFFTVYSPTADKPFTTNSQKQSTQYPLKQHSLSWAIITPWGTTRRPHSPAKYLTDLDFADDIVLLSSTVKGAQKLLRNLEKVALSVGLKINQSKAEYM